MGMTAELKQAVPSLLGCGALLAACGLAAACGSTPASGGTSAGPTSAAKVSLTIVQTAGPGSVTKRFTLRCEPAGGSYPDPAAICAQLPELRSILSPQPHRHVMCPMILADARTYVVHGTLLGHKVHESIADGGCTLSRWSQLNKILN